CWRYMSYEAHEEKSANRSETSDAFNNCAHSRTKRSHDPNKPDIELELHAARRTHLPVLGKPDSPVFKQSMVRDPTQQTQMHIKEPQTVAQKITTHAQCQSAMIPDSSCLSTAVCTKHVSI